MSLIVDRTIKMILACQSKQNMRPTTKNDATLHVGIYRGNMEYICTYLCRYLLRKYGEERVGANEAGIGWESGVLAGYSYIENGKIFQKIFQTICCTEAHMGGKQLTLFAVPDCWPLRWQCACRRK